MDYRSVVNPTYLTAKSTLFMLAGAGNGDAKRMIAALGAQDVLTRRDTGNGGQPSPLSPEEAKALMTGVTLSIEARYAAVSRFLRTEGYTRLLDVACGYTPRSLYCGQNGVDYVGLDVPVVAEELQALADGLGLPSDHPAYVGGDATNAASLEYAASLLEGRLLISCEGLLSYLSADEAGQLADGLRQILLRHGGAWITSDFGVDYEAFATAGMSSPDAARRYNEARRQTVKSANIYNEGVSNWDEAKKRAFLRGHGLNVELLPFWHGDEALTMLREVPEAWSAAYRRLLETSSLWKMTADPSFTGEPVIEGAKQTDNLRIACEKRDAALLCRVAGRIDTISAPALLETFETFYEGISAIELDAAALEYISSAGLRVLMMAVKRLGPGSVTVVNASDVVREIFETTGFDQMIAVK